MRSLSVHPNHYNFFFFFSFSIRKEKCHVYQQKKEKQNLILIIWFLEKKLWFTFGTLLSLSSYVDIERSSAEYNSAESMINKYKHFGTKSKQTVNFSNIPKKPFPLTSSNKYIMIEEFKDEIKRFKKYIEWDK